MEPLLIELTDGSPKVILDDQNQVFLFEGESRPQDAFKFFDPVIHWLQEYSKVLYSQKQHLGKNRTMTIQFRLSYLNSPSAKNIKDILSILESYCKDGYEVRVKWFYYKEDIDMKELGEEYAKIVEQLPINLVLIDGAEEKD